MSIKNLILIVVAAVITFVLGFGGIWFMLNGSHSGNKQHETPAAETEHDNESTALTSTVDLFQLTLPCKRDAEGNTPIVHADFQLVIPIKHRLKIEENDSRVRDIIATLLRNSDIAEINRDNLVGLKKQIIQQAKNNLNVEIEEVLVLRFDYDIIRARH